MRCIAGGNQMASSEQMLQANRKVQWQQVELKFQTLSGQGALTLDVPEDSLLIAYQLRMQQENPVPGLLPLSCIHRDNQVMLSWRVTSLQPLSLLFERRCWTVPDMMHLIRQLYRILFRLEDLLLDEGRLLLDNRYMMIDPVSMELHLAYVPLDGCSFGENPVRHLLQRWVMGDCRLADGESSGLMELVKMLNAPDFHWTRLETICSEWRLQENLPIPDEPIRKQGSTQMMGAAQTNKPVKVNDVIQKREPFMKNDSSSKRISVLRNDQTLNNGLDRKVESAMSGNPYGKRLDMSIWLPWKEGLQANLQSAGGGGKTGLIRKLALQVVVLLLLAIACSEGLLRVKGTDGISAWVGMALVVMALEAFAFMRKPKESPDGNDVAHRPSAGLKETSGSRCRQPAQDAAVNLSDVIETTCPSPSALAKTASAKIASAKIASAKTASAKIASAKTASAKTASAKTASAITASAKIASVPAMQDIGPKADDVIATDDINKFGQTQLLPAGNGWHLQYLRPNGRAARMDLTGMPFLLGRFRDQVDGCLEHPAVGKIHAEIRETAEGLCIVDLNSRNGTRINGNRLDPYLAVPLSPGDVIRLANEELVFACDVEGILSHFQ